METAKDKPLVSVLICTYNAEKFIETTLTSVLNQTYKNIEVLILDNNSNDRTIGAIEKVMDSKIKLHKSKTNLGAYQGLNYLLDRARGKYIAINDHDDIWHPEKLQKQIEFLENNEDYIGCGTGIINWYEKYDKMFYRSHAQTSDTAWHTSLVFRNEGFRYDTSIKIATDFYFMKHILCQNKKIIHNMPEPYVFRRIFKNCQNLSGRWMRQVTLSDLIRLRINLIDKIALINRFIVPQEVVEWFLMFLMGGRFPEQFNSEKSFFDTYMKHNPR